MEIIKIKKNSVGINTSAIVKDETVVAIGNFDGLHLGHEKLLNEAKLYAKKNKKQFGVITFEPHPRDFFSPKDKNFKLVDKLEKKDF